MSILQIELPDEELQFISEEARARGFEDNAQYVRSVLREKRGYKESAVERNLAPEQLKREEKLLLEAAHSNRTEFSPELWADLRIELETNAGEKS